MLTSRILKQDRYLIHNQWVAGSCQTRPTFKKIKRMQEIWERFFYKLLQTIYKQLYLWLFLERRLETNLTRRSELSASIQTVHMSSASEFDELWYTYSLFPLIDVTMFPLLQTIPFKYVLPVYLRRMSILRERVTSLHVSGTRQSWVGG